MLSIKGVPKTLVTRNYLTAFQLSVHCSHTPRHHWKGLDTTLRWTCCSCISVLISTYRDATLQGSYCWWRCCWICIHAECIIALYMRQNQLAYWCVRVTTHSSRNRLSSPVSRVNLEAFTKITAVWRVHLNCTAAARKSLTLSLN
jgi:hypothetical protein